MSDTTEKTYRSATVSLKDVRTAIQAMSITDITAVIEFAEQTRQEKQEKAQQELIAEFRQRASQMGFSFDELINQNKGSGTIGQKPRGKKAAVKYRGPNGEEWTGRGRSPAWLAALEAEGNKRERFLAR